MNIGRIEVIAKERGYYVNEVGLMFNKNGQEIGKGTRKGYYCTSLRVNGKTIKLPVHRLQAYQKYGDRLFDNGICVRHKNGNSLDNSIDNILIGTHSDNMMDQPKHIRVASAINASSHIKKYDVDEVKRYYEQTSSYKKTMDKFNISSKGTLHNIINR